MMGCALPWKLLLLLPILIVLLVPTYLFGTGVGGSMLSSLTDFFYTLAAPRASATPTPPPALPVVLPQAGSVLYTVREGDNCVAVLVFQMRMENASQVFSDAKPETVKALNTSFGEDCHRLQPGMVLPLSPHYPLVTLGGLVRKIEAATPRQVLPTPLIRVPNQQPNTADCSGGCLLTVQIAPQVQVRLHVRTTLSIRTGAWVWTRAMIARKTIRGFDNYPYADPHAPFNGMTLHACDFQVDDTHDDNGLSCRQLQPNTIDDDGGVWLLGVTGAAGLDHWRYQLRLPPNTRVLLWLTATSKGLEFKRGNPLYRYDNVKQVYVNV
jgi:hypothetical protein